MNREISKIGRRLRNYEKRERQLISPLGHDQVTKDYVLDEVNKLKRECEAGQEELQKLKDNKARLSDIAHAEIKLNEFCERVRQNLDNATLQNKRLALDALDIKITA